MSNIEHNIRYNTCMALGGATFHAVDHGVYNKTIIATEIISLHALIANLFTIASYIEKEEKQ